MEKDETQQDGAETTVEETTSEGQVGAEGADPFDAITDIDELRKIAKGERAKATRRNKSKEETPTKPVTAPQAPASNSDDIDSVLSLQAEGYSPSEIKSLREYGRKMGKPIQEVAIDPVIKAGFDAMRAKAKTAEALPSPSRRTPTFKGKSLADNILTGSPADAKAAVEAHLASRMGPKNSNE